VILRNDGSLGKSRGKPHNALRAKGVEKEEEEDQNFYPIQQLWTAIFSSYLFFSIFLSF
jgi:hypothetical protein